MSHVRLGSTPAIVIALSILGTSPVEAEGPAPGTPTAVAVPGARYEAGGLHRFFFGSRYRELWTAPVEADVLDVRTFGGGLTPTGTGGGKQTLSLRFTGEDGRPYTFRALDKDPSETLPPDLRGTFLNDLFQDQISSSFPTAHVVVPPILDAVNVLHVAPRLCILPDDPALGEYREEFAGQMGMIEEWPNEGPEGTPGFAGATRVEGTTELFGILQADPRERVDAANYLAARLVDILLGDWDRHRGQFRWANLGGGSPPAWLPIPEDRDQAFARYDGLMLAFARDPAPQLLNFGKKIAGMEGATWNGRDVDRRLLVGLSRAVWDSVAASVAARITDEVIEDAVRRLPRAHFDLAGRELVETLEVRRDALPGAARRFYRHLAGEVDVYGTDRAERVEAVHEGGRFLTVTMAADGGTTYERRFDRKETREVRLHLLGGDDEAAVHGDAEGGVLLRVVGGEGADRVRDEGRRRATRVYDVGAMEAPGLGVDARPYVPGTPPDEPGPRDWGSRIRYRELVGGNSDIGLFVALGIQQKKYGFRKRPEARRTSFQAGLAAKRTGWISLDTVWRAENSAAFRRLEVLLSRVEILHFFGFGNETEEIPEDSAKVELTQFRLLPSYSLPLGSRLRFSPKLDLSYYATEDDVDHLVGVVNPYGAGEFGEAGALVELTYDSRDVAAAPAKGVFARVEGGIYPELWDVDETFGHVAGELAAYASPVRRVTLGLRGGGKKLWGDRIPYQNAATLGGSARLRGYQQDRFIGDASAFGSIELRWTLGEVFLLLPSDVGLLALADAGRVYLDGEESDTWHTSVGGGVWIAPLTREHTVGLTVAGGDEGTRIYVQLGLGY